MIKLVLLLSWEYIINITFIKLRVYRLSAIELAVEARVWRAVEGGPFRMRRAFPVFG